MSKFSERFRELRNARGLSQQKLADNLNTSKSSVNMYERGDREPGLEMLETIADYFNVDMDYLLGKSNVANKALYQSNSTKEHEPSNISAVIPSNKIYQIPVFETVSAGFGAHAEENVIDYLPIVIENPYDVPDMLGIKVNGNSMYPKIENGDVIIVRKQESVDSGDIAVVMIDGEEGVVKKVLYGDDWIELHSFNPEYMPRRFEGADVERLRVVGIVKGVMKMF